MFGLTISEIDLILDMIVILVLVTNLLVLGKALSNQIRSLVALCMGRLRGSYYHLKSLSQLI